MSVVTILGSFEAGWKYIQTKYTPNILFNVKSNLPISEEILYYFIVLNQGVSDKDRWNTVLVDYNVPPQIFSGLIWQSCAQNLECARILGARISQNFAVLPKTANYVTEYFTYDVGSLHRDCRKKPLLSVCFYTSE
jgi:hypothetical protein